MSKLYAQTTYEWTIRVQLKDKTYRWYCAEELCIMNKPKILWTTSTRKQARSMARCIWIDMSGEILSATPVRVSVLTQTLP